MATTWTGCYIGANGGGAWARKNGTSDGFYAEGEWIANPYSLGSLTADGWAAGGQIGCDFQFNNNWVIGIRGMWDASDLKGSDQFQNYWATGNISNVKIDSFGTVVGKLGYLINPTLQLYGLGGVAWVKDHYFITAPGYNSDIVTGDQIRTGYDVGVGLSWMFARNWDLWVEYDHMGFGTEDVNLQATAIFNPVYTSPVAYKQNVVEFGRHRLSLRLRQRSGRREIVIQSLRLKYKAPALSGAFHLRCQQTLAIHKRLIVSANGLFGWRLIEIRRDRREAVFLFALLVAYWHVARWRCCARR